MMNKIKRLAGRSKAAYAIIYIFFNLCGVLISLLFLVMRVFPIRKKKIVCCNMKGKRYGDNPKYIVDELIKQKPDYEIVWLIRPEYKTEVPEGIRPVSYNIFHIVYELATAGFWIDSNTKHFGTLKRKNQYYIQTWHGSYGLKKLFRDILDKITLLDKKSVQHDAGQWDLLLSNSRFTTQLYKRALWYDGEVMECGSPRNDIFFKDRQIYIEKVKNFFHIQGKKTVLYAPTYRSDFGTDKYRLDYDLLRKSLEKRFGGEWAVLVRLHPNNISDAADFMEYTDHVINATEYADMQELLAACDVLVSDYSSCMFDFVTKKAPCFIYATDVQKYKDERDFYFDIHELPFPLAENNEEMEKNILQFDQKGYDDKLQALFDTVGLCDEGNACKQTVNWILQHT